MSFLDSWVICGILKINKINWRLFGIIWELTHHLVILLTKESIKIKDYGENSKLINWNKDQSFSLPKDSWSLTELSSK